MMALAHMAGIFFGGMLLTNAAPHLISGVMGRPFQSPFARPPGVGLSSSTVNVLWGFLNLAAGYALVWQAGRFDARSVKDAAVLGLAILLTALATARLFGRLHGGNSPGRD
jgi:hypothetical protein